MNNGDELYKVLLDSVECFGYFAKDRRSNIGAVLDEIKDREDLIEIEMEEGTYSGDGDPYQFYLKYDFQESKVVKLENGYY